MLQLFSFKNNVAKYEKEFLIAQFLDVDFF